MPEFKVLLTDYAWPELEIEQQILASAGAELVVATQQDVETLVQLAAGVDAIMTCWAQTTAEVIAAAEDCRHVARIGIGLDNIDVDYCTRHGIPVTNVPDYCMDEVAEHTLALIFALARKIGLYHSETKSRRYNAQIGPPVSRIAGQTLGIVGLGNIGRCLAAKAQGVGLKVIASKRPIRRESLPPGVHQVPLDELLETSDFVSLHLPLNPETRNMISARQLSRMKPSAYLINTARGGLIDHLALAAALAQDQLAGAGLDVQDPEPPDLSLPPFNDPRVIVTPHTAFLSTQSLRELRHRAATQVATRLSGGTPENIVNIPSSAERPTSTDC